MIVLVCGGRGYHDQRKVNEVLDAIEPKPTLLVQGGAMGADRLAAMWARSRGIHVAEVPALWEFHGKKAGPLRNDVMLSIEPSIVVAFPGGRGTFHLSQRAKSAGFTVVEVSP